jgi:ATP-dependent Clp protease ATP-binding subunit ClpA
LVSDSDAARKNGDRITKVKQLIIKNDDYQGIVDAAHDRLGSLIEDLTADNAEIYVHNPPRILKTYLEEQKRHSLIELDVKQDDYEVDCDSNMFAQNIEKISSIILGQQRAITEISKGLWYLNSVKRKKPYVIMLYGNSGLGKTELVREIAHIFFGGNFLEKHLSMFKNNNYADYFFGEAHNRRSLGFDLLERESNLVFFDELDKCPEHFYSAFYTLFDNIEFKDSTYDVDVSGIVIFLTSNYQSQAEMKKQLGLPIFYRIDKMIHFENFSKETIYSITKKEIEAKVNECEGKFNYATIYKAVSPLISTTGENARTIKYKVQQVIEELMYKKIHNQSGMIDD